MKRILKRTTKQYIIVALICTIVMGGAAVFTSLMITGQIKEKYTTLLADARQELNDNKRTVFVAAADILTGEFITTENVKKLKVYSSQPQDTYISGEDIGRTALIDIKAGTQVIKGMLTDCFVASGLRELEYSVINISSNIYSNDTVDVRISYPNGETYVVLTKKIIKGYTPETATCFFWLNEEELLRMSAAIVDAGLYTGSSLYVTKYIEPNIQEASIVNYTPSLSILNLLENDPNILTRVTQKLSREVRKSLENRLAENLETDVSDISWEVAPDVHYTITPTPVPTVLPEVSQIPEQTQKPDQQQEGAAADIDEELGSTSVSEDYFYLTEDTGKEG